GVPGRARSSAALCRGRARPRSLARPRLRVLAPRSSHARAGLSVDSPGCCEPGESGSGALGSSCRPLTQETAPMFEAHLYADHDHQRLQRLMFAAVVTLAATATTFAGLWTLERMN